MQSNKRMQPDFGKLRLPQPLMRSVMRYKSDLVNDRFHRLMLGKMNLTKDGEPDVFLLGIVATFQTKCEN